jgi:hypothetical protein
MLDYPILNSNIFDGPIELTRNGVLSSASLKISLNGMKPSCKGAQCLVQLVIKFLLTSPGFNIFSPIGSKMASMIGASLPLDKLNSLKTDILLSLSTIETQIKDMQLQMDNLVDEETLDHISLRNFSYTADSMSIAINIYNKAGSGYPISVVV